METSDLDRLMQAHWQAQKDFIPLDAGRVQARQRTQKRRLWLDLSGSAFSVGIGLLFWWLGNTTLFYIAGAMMVLSGIGSGILASRARKPLLDWGNWTPQGILEYRLRESETDLKLVRNTGYAVLALILFTLYLWWGSYFTPRIVPADFALRYTICVAPAVLLTLWWARRRRTRALRQQLEISAALKSFQEHR